MTPFRRPAVRLILAAGAAGLLVPAVPALADELVVTTAGVVFSERDGDAQPEQQRGHQRDHL
jgi:hypothetical protein